MFIKVLKNISKILNSTRKKDISINNKCIKIHTEENLFYFKSQKNIHACSYEHVLNMHDIFKIYSFKDKDFRMDIQLAKPSYNINVCFNILYKNKLLFTSLERVNIDNIESFFTDCINSFIFYSSLKETILDSMTREMPIFIKEIRDQFVTESSFKYIKVYHKEDNGSYQAIALSEDNIEFKKAFYEFNEHLFMPTKGVPNNYGKLSNYGLEYNFDSLQPFHEYLAYKSELKLFKNLFVLKIKNNKYELKLHLCNIEGSLKLEVNIISENANETFIKYYDAVDINLNIINDDVLTFALTYFMHDSVLDEYGLTLPLTQENIEMLKLLHY